ncbi:MAG: FecR family protein [Prolixibacteraceae bacterium]
MREIAKYIDNSLFIKWVYEPDDNLSEYWNYYLKKHPEERLVISSLKKELGSIRISNQKLSEEQKGRLALKIIEKMQHRHRTPAVDWFSKVFLRYAAFAILFFCLGGTIVYLSQERKFVFSEEQYLEIPDMAKNPVLVLADGNMIDLRRNESEVDYTDRNQIVINKDSIVPLKSTGEDEAVFQDQILVPYGTRARVTLSDQSVVWLNAGSRLIYPSAFRGKEREVILFGEAFFEVEKNPEQPFIVKTSGYRIKVLGTRFNVSAYPGDEISQTVLTEGSVEVTLAKDNWFDKNIVLKPNELFAYNKVSDSSTIEKVKPEMYVLWKDGILQFEKEDLSRILKKLERFYNIRIELKNPTDGAVKLDGKLNLKEDTYEVLHYLCRVADKDFKPINGKHFVIE